MPRKDSDDILATRPPINAYQEQPKKYVFVGNYDNWNKMCYFISPNILPPF